ncbi:hypothetical protein AOZ07_01380 [Glutamicibacter halophytocola]|nr:hypothetical protein AOZ07_01380 [Glutamicibacter halophytocola]
MNLRQATFPKLPREPFRKILKLKDTFNPPTSSIPDANVYATITSFSINSSSYMVLISELANKERFNNSIKVLF